jgi:hypothetical protein
MGKGRGLGTRQRLAAVKVQPAGGEGEADGVARRRRRALGAVVGQVGPRGASGVEDEEVVERACSPGSADRPSSTWPG